MKGLFCLIFISVLLLAVQNYAKVFPYPVETTTLSNGMGVVIVPMKTPGVVSFYLLIKTGSRNEVEKGKSGFAHFFEHMMFRGTKQFPPEKYNAILKEMGADSNAYTSDDRTVYHITGPAEALEKIFEIESDRFQNLAYSEEAFKKEAGAVLGEYRKSAVNPIMKLFEELQNLAFTTHTYKHTTIGFYEDILDMPNQYEHSLDFFSRYYRPENAILIVAGDVTKDKVFPLAKKYFGRWEKGYNPKPIPQEPPQKEAKRKDLLWELPTNPYIFMGYHAPTFDPADKTVASLEVISELLFSPVAPLYQTLVVDKQWVDFVEGWYEFHKDPSLYYILARVKKKTWVAEVEKTIHEALKNLKVTKKKLEAVKSHLRHRFARSLTTSDRVANILAVYLSLTDSPKSIDAFYDTLFSLTPEDIQKTVEKIFIPTNQTVVTLSQKEEKK